MDATTAAVVAALGASLLTGGFSLGISELQALHRRRAHRRDEQRQAYTELLAYAGLLGQSANVLHLTMAIRSGLVEGLDVALGARRPLEPLELHAEMRKDFEPIFRAWSQIWTIGGQRPILAANAVLDAAAELLGAATMRGKARGNLWSALAGEKWSEEQLAPWEASERRLAEARRAFTLVARREIGSEAVEPFSSAAVETPV
jgi:hypothetical protein